MWKGHLSGPLLSLSISISPWKTTSQLGQCPHAQSAYMQARLCGRGLSFRLSVRLQLILQLIMQQPLWLIRSKQRAFNPIHVFSSIVSSLSNTIRFRMQSREEAGIGHTCLAGLQAGGSQSENSWLRRWQSWEDLGESHSLAPAQRREGAIWGLQAEKHFLG